MTVCDVDEAFFGERHGAHSVLSTSIDINIARKLAHHLDLPGQIPPGFTFDNYVSGFPFDGLYIVARTTPDLTATRPGMVFSHAFLLPIKDIGNLDDLLPLFERLSREPREKPDAKRQTLPSRSVRATRSESFRGITEALMSGTDGPAVVSETIVLEEAVVAIWPQLPALLRRRFRFMLSFGPEDLPDAGANLVCTPASMARRWSDNCVVANPTLNRSRLSSGASYLAGDPQPEFENFIADLDAEISTFRIFVQIDQAWARYQQTPPSYSSDLSAARLLSALQPSPRKGQDAKAVLLERLSPIERVLTSSEILQLRNFETTAFTHGASLWKKVISSVRSAMSSRSESTDILNLCEAVHDPKKANETWRKAFLSALSSIPVSGLPNFASNVWTALALRPEVGQLLLEHGPTAVEFDLILAGSLNEEDPPQFSPIISESLLRHNFVLAEADLLAAHHRQNLENALAVLCARGSSAPVIKAVDRLISKMQASDVLSSVLSIKHDHLFERAAGFASERPCLLAHLDFSNQINQLIWAKAMERNRNAWQAVPSLRKTTDDLLSSLLNDPCSVAKTLLQQIAETPLANLLNHRRRSEIWSALPKCVDSAFRSRTAEAWIESFRNGTWSREEQIEEPLRATLGSESYLPQLIAAIRVSSFANALPVFSAIEALPEEVFQYKFSEIASERDGLDASIVEAVSRLIMVRDWGATVRQLLIQFGARSDLRPLFVTCAKHIDFFSRYLNGFVSPSPQDLLRILKETAIDLYPSGPTTYGIWDRAGGHEADLALWLTGREQWENAFATIERGGKVRPRLLISAMLDDYPNNTALLYLTKEGL